MSESEKSEKSGNGGGRGAGGDLPVVGPSMQFGFGEVAPGVIRMQIVQGPSMYLVDLPRDTARQVAKNWIAECDRSESGLVIASSIGGKMPRIQ